MGALAAAGILGGLAMVFAQLTKQQMQAQKRAETGVEIVALSQRVVRTLYDGKACINTLGAGKNIIPQASFDLDAIKNKDDQVVYQALTADPNAPSYGNRLLKVASLKLVVNTNPNPIPGDQAGAMLEVTLQKISSAYTGQVETVKKFPVTLELDAAKKLVGCVSDISAVADPVKEAICKEIGGTSAWNTGSKKCTFGACPSGQYLEGFDTSGKVCTTPPQVGSITCSQGEAVTKIQGGVPECAAVGSTTTGVTCGTGTIEVNGFCVTATCPTGLQGAPPDCGVCNGANESGTYPNCVCQSGYTRQGSSCVASPQSWHMVMPVADNVQMCYPSSTVPRDVFPSSPYWNSSVTFRYSQHRSKLDNYLNQHGIAETSCKAVLIRQEVIGYLYVHSVCGNGMTGPGGSGPGLHPFFVEIWCKH